MSTIDVYYDYRSPYAYFMSRQLPPLASRLGIEAHWHPVSIHVLLNLQVGRAPGAPYQDPLPPIKRQYLMTDVVRGAQQRQLPIALPKSLDSLRALQVSLRLEGSEAEPLFRDCVWQAMWIQQKDTSDPEVLVACLDHLGAEASPIVSSALSDDYAKGIEARSIDAFSKGVFGVPSIVANAEVFFGSDRLDALEWRLTARP